ncbi:MAG: MFS transporter, partial [Lactobacillus sp.]|nr:MFS transporter [Lactobacillus sp.]
RLNIGILLLLASFALLLLPFKDNYGLYVTSMCLLTLGEILLFPGVASFVDIESPKNLTGYYQGRVQMFSALGKAIGPLFGALIIDNTNYEFLFLICVLMAFLSLLIFTLPVISASKNSKFIH